ncbi:MAG: hypothetical protein WC506_05540 [Candidatus Micrarchaeia archaeon]
MFGIVKAIGLGITAAVAGAVLAVFGIIAIFFFAIIGAVMGAITGWIVGLVPILGPLVKEGFATFGFANANLVAVGAALGFVAGFFKNANNNNNTVVCDEEREARWKKK